MVEKLPPCIDDGGFAPDCVPLSAHEPEFTDGVAWGERHLQCIWADKALRPILKTTDGLSVAVLDPGKWNNGPGPDFLGATLKIGSRKVCGDVEIHVRPADWLYHGHAGDPAYSSVVLHVAWFPPRRGTAIPPLPLIVLSDAFATNPDFSFDKIDIGAYPWGQDSAMQRPCRESLRNAPPEIVHSLLEEAGRIRAARKARELQARMSLASSPDQAFYEETLAALGWSRNEGAMRRLATLVPVQTLSSLASDTERYALLLARAGLLPQKAKAQTRQAQLWNIAFRLGATDDNPGQPHWMLGGTRPANHPRNRLAAAAAMFRSASALRNAVFSISRDDPGKWIKSVAAAFENAASPGAELLAEQTAAAHKRNPLGASRIHALVANFVIPAIMISDPGAVRLLNALPGEDIGAAMKEAAHRLFGPDHNPALLYGSSALRTQGLLELWRGRCRAAPELCAGCPLSIK